MTARLIYPEDFSEDMTSMPTVDQLLFLGIVALCDEYETIDGDPRWLRLKIFGNSPGVSKSRILKGLQRLTDKGLISVIDDVQKLSRYKITSYDRCPRFDGHDLERVNDEEMISKEKKEDSSITSLGILERASGVPIPSPSSPTLTNSKPSDVSETIAMHFHFGWSKSSDIVTRFSMTLEDVEAWRAYEQLHGTALAKMFIQRYRNPTDIPKTVEGRSGPLSVTDDDLEKISRKISK